MIFGVFVLKEKRGKEKKKRGSHTQNKIRGEGYYTKRSNHTIIHPYICTS
jgi:hypothetical protein